MGNRRDAGKIVLYSRPSSELGLSESLGSQLPYTCAIEEKRGVAYSYFTCVVNVLKRLGHDRLAVCFFVFFFFFLPGTPSRESGMMEQVWLSYSELSTKDYTWKMIEQVWYGPLIN